MLVFCEECGERYILEDEVDPENGLTFRCRKCNELVKVMLPRAESVDKVKK